MYGVGRNASQSLVNIMSVNSILVHCNIIHSSYMRGAQDPVAYNFFPNDAPGQKILPSNCRRNFNIVSVADGSTRKALGFSWRGIDYTFSSSVSSSIYVQYIVNVSENQVDTLKDAIRLKKGATLYFPKGGIRGDHVLLLTPAQINRLGKTEVEGKRAQIRMCARQVARNVSSTGGFLGASASLAARVIPLAARALPTILSRLKTGLLSGGINKAISGSGVGDGL